MDPNENLPAAHAQLDNAIAYLCGVQTIHTPQGTRTAPCLLIQLTQAIHTPRHHGTGSGSHDPVWLGGLDLLHTIDTTTQGWARQRGHTMSLLNDLLIRSWRPQDAPHLNAMAETIHHWAQTIDDLLSGQKHIRLAKAPCPQCSAITTRQAMDGEWVKVPALNVHAKHGCRCLACGAQWPTEHFHFLAEVLAGDER